MEKQETETPPPMADIAGIIVDSVTESPIDGVDVKVLGPDPERSTQTNSSGAFYLTDISPNISYIFIFSKTGYYPRSINQSLNVGYNTIDADGKTLKLEPITSIKNKVTVIGTVKDSYNNGFLSDVDVQILGYSYSSRSNDTGTFLMSDIDIPSNKGDEAPTLDVTFLFSKDGYLPKTVNTTLTGGTTIQMDPVSLDRKRGTIIVTVFDSTTQAKITGAQVSFQGFTPSDGVTTKDTVNGSVVFSDIPIGTYSFLISHNEHASTTISGIVISQDNQTVNASAYLNKEIVNIDGYVYNETNNYDGFQTGSGGDIPLAEIKVKVEVDRGVGSSIVGEAVSQSNGYFRIINLPVGIKYTISTSGDGSLGTDYRHEEKVIDLTRGDNRVDVGLYKTTGVISGYVFLDSNGDGVYTMSPR
jgi:hypothetical protein